MVIVYEGTPERYYMDGYLQSNLDIAKTVNKKDWDFCFIIDGKERAGKSILAQQIAKYLDEGFNLDSIVFTPIQFERAVKSSDNNKAIVYDEAFGGLNSRNFMSGINKSIIKMLTEIGFKNLFLIIVLPSFFDLDRYVSLWRSSVLFHVYTSDNLERGFFSAYSGEAKKSLYLNGKKFYDYKIISPSFRARFTNHYTVDKEKYIEKKRISATNIDEKKLEDAKQVREEFINFVLANDKLTSREMIHVLNMKPITLYKRLQKFRKKQAELKQLKDSNPLYVSKESDEDYKEIEAD